MPPSRKIRISSSAQQIMMEFAESSPSREVLGVIFGFVNDQEEVCITKAHPFRVGQKHEVQFIDEDYERVYPLIKSHEAEGLIWLGWFHSHPFKGGDHIYMSKTDIKYHSNAQNGNPNWTAIVINPHQCQDPNTFHGMRAFRTISPSKKLFSNKSNNSNKSNRLIFSKTKVETLIIENL
ncbi:MAG: hypothetical protein ACTSRK_08515 [Promethearchaeota archaeon]